LALSPHVESISTCGDNRLFCFFCSAHLASKITGFCSYLYQYRHDINKNMIPLAPPLQEGMGEASLVPQGAPPLAAVAAEDDPAQRPWWRQRQQTAANRINNQQTT
jgi:hypothetical protein